MRRCDIPWPLAIVLGLVVDVIVGAWQGFWVAYVGIPAFIVTLAGMLLFRGLDLMILNASSVSVPDGFQVIANGFIPDWVRTPAITTHPAVGNPPDRVARRLGDSQAGCSAQAPDGRAPFVHQHYQGEGEAQPCWLWSVARLEQGCPGRRPDLGSTGERLHVHHAKDGLRPPYLLCRR